MRKILSIIFLTFAAFALFSCSENDETSSEYENWQVRNDEYFTQIYNMAKDQIKADSLAKRTSEWKIINKYSVGDTTLITNKIVAKVITPQTDPTDTQVPLITDTVSVYYAGYLMPSASYNTRPYSYYPTNVGYTFNKSWYGSYNLSTMSTVDFTTTKVGFQTATMNMHKGERWLVYVPYSLGYGGSAQTSIPAYSTLIFDITLEKIKHPQKQK